MKKRVMNLIAGLVILTGLVLLYTRCESDASEMAEMDAVAAMVADRGGAAGQIKDICPCLNSQFPLENLSKAEKDALLFMREEEKMARDVYKAMLDLWNVPVFSNIMEAEQRHMDAILCLLNKYQLTDPVGNNPAGVFQNTNLQNLYNALLAEGKQSKAAAFTAGAKIEDVDIADLMKLRTDMDNADIRAVFDELTRGSRNHLRAFANNLKALNLTYTPTNITQQLFDEITASPREKGSAICGTCPNPNNPNCKANANCKGTKGGKACPGQGPNGNGTCNGNSPGKGTCNGNGPGKGNGPGNGGNGNGPGNGNGNGPGNGNGNGNGPGNGNGNGGN